MSHKVALLSNVNMSFVTRILQKSMDMYAGEGYGNELGLLMDRSSSYHVYGPDICVLLMDVWELVGHDVENEEAVDRWFAMLSSALDANTTYYISDAYIWGADGAVFVCPEKKQLLESYWLKNLKACMEKHGNVRVFPYGGLVRSVGEASAFSEKLWYMGKILHTNDMQKKIAELILHKVELESRVPKKVLVLDLDNTLWGGLAGESDITPIVLSEDHSGMAYKNLQRMIKQMKESGVILAIASKNNEQDAMEIIEKHPHMVLRKDDFAARRINWDSKAESITQMAKELNLGTDSFVFFDDSASERELVKQMLPEVIVPDFPGTPEELPGAMLDIYRQYFEKATVTREDAEKSTQYLQNAKRAELERTAVSFADYLKQLSITAFRVDAVENAERLTQLLNKTNQFNLTTKRHDPSKMRQMLEDASKQIYLYRVEDNLGDYGIVAAVIVDVSTIPTIEEFVMSCRIMGKYVEYGILDAIEAKLRESGFDKVRGLYIPTPKNKPVEKLYEKAGYTLMDETEGGFVYELDLTKCPDREYYMEML